MKGLILAGGGAKGAFQAGAISYIIKEKRWIPDIVFGTSVGALNATLVAQKEWKKLIEIWENIKASDVFYFNPLRIILNPLGFSSIYCNSPLRKLMKKHYSYEKIKESNIELYVTRVSLETGEIEYVGKEAGEKELFESILASTVIPFAFPPNKINSQHYVDGGVIDIAPSRFCIKKGCDEIIVILNSPRKIEPSYKEWSAFNICLRTLDILLNEILLNDVEKILFYNKLIEKNKKNTLLKGKRFINVKIIEPKEPMGEVLDFRSEIIQWRLQRGIERAKEVLES